MGRDAMNAPTVDILIPTLNNSTYLYPCLWSLVNIRATYPYNIIVINNGHPDSVGDVPEQGVRVIQTGGKNLGWEGALKRGLQESQSEYVVFANDDIFIPRPSLYWCRQLLGCFADPRVAAVGPSSNIVMGAQNIFAQIQGRNASVPYLIGFCVMLKRAILDEIGGIDDTLPGGDDLDLGIRFRKAGYLLIACLELFVYHHGFKTGERIHPNYWNSADMQEATDNALIRKHGFKWWWSLFEPLSFGPPRILEDIEGQAVAGWVQGERVLELGCGERKSVSHAVGIDLYPGGETTWYKQRSVADIVADVFQPMPMFESDSADTLIARHVIEHAVDPVLALKEWRRLLKPGGRLVVAAPNEALNRSIPMDIHHKHAWTPDSFRSLVELCGFKQVAYTPDCGNNVSFVTVAEKA